MMIAGARLVMAALKTQGFYERALNQAVRDLYNGRIPDSEFIDKQIYLVEEQFPRAWREGARDVDFNPANMTEGDTAILQERITAEQDHILDFAQAIMDAAKEGQPIDPLLARADLWAARYPEVVNAARVHFGGRMHLVWNVGPTEHCRNCLALDGVVAEASEWEQARASGIYPKSPELACHGYNCACELNPTDDEITEGGIPGL
jgi:hypothetical protein